MLLSVSNTALAVRAWWRLPTRYLAVNHSKVIKLAFYRLRFILRDDENRPHFESSKRTKNSIVLECSPSDEDKAGKNSAPSSLQFVQLEELDIIQFRIVYFDDLDRRFELTNAQHSSGEFEWNRPADFERAEIAESQICLFSSETGHRSCRVS